MRAFKWAAAIIAAGLLLLVLMGCSSTASIHPESVVKITTASGHGSGFHIGNGYVFSAAHVIGEAQSVEIKSASGEMHDAEVLWTNSAYDVALLRIPDSVLDGAARIACRTPYVGESIIAKGNPGNNEFVTVWGRVGGDERAFGPWKALVVTDIAVVPGQSGGPVYDRNGRVVGMTVGVMVARVGFGMSIVGIGYAVPASTLCSLMARGV